MEKRAILAIVLSLVVVVAWSILFAPFDAAPSRNLTTLLRPAPFRPIRSYRRNPSALQNRKARPLPAKP